MIDDTDSSLNSSVSDISEISCIDIEALYRSLANIVSECGEKRLIAMKIISKATAWRWRKEVNTDYPDCNIVLKVLQEHSGLRKLPELTKHYGADIKLFLEQSFSGAINYVTELSIDENVYNLKDDYDFQIYFMCCNERGSTLDEITYTIGRIVANKADIPKEHHTDELLKSLGAISKPKIEVLEKSGVIELTSNGKYKSFDTSTYLEQRGALQQSVVLLSNNLNPDNWQSGENVFYLTSESVEIETAKLVSSYLKSAFLTASKMLNDSRSNSNTAVPFIINVMGEKLLYKTNRNGELH